MPSFLAKEGVFQIPFIGTVGRVNQMIGVARSSVEGRAITKKRVLEHIASPHTPPLLIFPEGTTSRNDSIIQFKAGGAFAAGVAVQPVLLRYYPCWCSTFDMSNTPGQNTKNWALRLLCAPWHSLVVTYLPPVVPDPAMQADSVLFANAVRSAMAEGMGPDAQISNQSYDEFFLWKLGREELKLPSSVLRTLEFKPAAAAVAESGGSAVGALTLERAKATMRGYDEAYRETTKAKAAASGQTELDPLVANQERERAGGEADRGGGVSADGFARALGFDSAGAPEAAAAWSAVVAAAGLGDDVGASLDFQQFLIGFQRAQPAPALAKGWLEPTEGAGDDTRV